MALSDPGQKRQSRTIFYKILPIRQLYPQARWSAARPPNSPELLVILPQHAHGGRVVAAA